MRAVTISDFGEQPILHEALPAPTPGSGQVLVRVCASSVNPVDNLIADGRLAGLVDHVFPVTLGRDFAGVVEAVGDGVGSVSVGDEVFGMVPSTAPVVHAGTWAELIVVPDAGLAHKADGVDMAVAGAACLVAVTAIMCVDALDLAGGETVLIVGATGGVGTVATQLCVAAGATVVAPGLPDDQDYLQILGVSEVLPRDGDVVAGVEVHHAAGVDAIIDLVNHAPGSYDAVLKEGGRVSSASSAAGEGPGRTNVRSTLSPGILARVAHHLADGTVKVPIQQAYKLTEAPEALRTLGATHTQGKIAVQVA